MVCSSERRIPVPLFAAKEQVVGVLRDVLAISGVISKILLDMYLNYNMKAFSCQLFFSTF